MVTDAYYYYQDLAGKKEVTIGENDISAVIFGKGEKILEDTRRRNTMHGEDEDAAQKNLRRRRTMDSCVSTTGSGGAAARKSSLYSRSEDSNLRSWLHEAKKQTESSKAASVCGSTYSGHGSFDRGSECNSMSERFLRKLSHQFNSAPATIMLPIWIVCFSALYKIARMVSADPKARTLFDEKIHALSATKLVEVRIRKIPIK
jgi:hypothetical protein